MARRPDPRRLYATRRAGLFSRLVAESTLSEHTAELRLTAYEANCRELHLDARKSEWWDGFWPWWEQQRQGSSVLSTPAQGPPDLRDSEQQAE